MTSGFFYGALGVGETQPCANPVAQRLPGWEVNSLASTGNAVVRAGTRKHDLSGAERARYQASIAAHRPHHLELLRWNHDPDGPDAETFRQLECLGGTHRHSIDGGPGGGVKWTPLELEGVFLRHTAGEGLLWLPEAGPNALLQRSAGEPWALLEVIQLERQSVITDKAVREESKEVVAMYADASFPVQVHSCPNLREAEPHLTEKWLEAAEDLRERWPWDWQPVRPTSGFAMSQSKL